MIKKLVFALVCLTYTGLVAQDSNASPYSIFGIGERNLTATVENQMMGGIGVLADSIHVNLQNPAAYGYLLDLKDNGKIVTYTGGLSYKMLRLESFSNRESTALDNIDYFALAFGLAKDLGVGIGVKPYSTVGYNISSQSTNAGGSEVFNSYNGDGGLNQVFLSTGYKIYKDLSLGVTVGYNFGTLDYNRVQNVEDVQFGTIDERQSKVKGLDFNFAASYNPLLKDKYRLYTNIRVNTQANLTSKNTQRVGSYSLVDGSSIEVVDVNLENQLLARTFLKIPTSTTLGVGYGKDQNWFIGGEYSFQDRSNFKNEFLGIDNVQYGNAGLMALGGYYLPNYAAFNGYFQRVIYRGGLRYGNTGMVVNNKDIKDFGITFGLGLPLGRNSSNLNLGFEFGTRGTATADLVEENYFKINVGFSLNDVWFVKRKIN